jgi:hypothetical protein
MTIYVEKPALNVKEKLKEVDKPSGVAGEALLRADTTRQQQELLGIGRRNIVMNGGFDIWQRGNSVTEPSNSYNNFTADRWSAYFAGTYTQQQTTLPNGDYVNYFRGVLGTTSANRININHFIENGNSIMSGKYVTVSFWLACDRPGSEVNVKLQTTSGTNFSSYTQIANKYIKTEQDWKKYEITFHCLDDKGNIGSRPHGLLELDGSDAQWPNGSTFEIAQVQIEIGRVATPFEHRTFGEELALCQRYYVMLAAGADYDERYAGGSSHIIGTMHKWNTTNTFVFTDLPVSMRNSNNMTLKVPAPTSNAFAFKSGGYTATGNGLSLDGDSSNRSIRLNTALTNSNWTLGCSGWVRCNQTSAYCAIDCEL